MQRINKSQSDYILYKKEGYAKDFLYKLRQQRKGFLSNLTESLNRANTEVDLPNNYQEVFIVMEKINFAITKLERVTNEICSIAPHDIQRKANILLAENKARESKGSKGSKHSVCSNISSRSSNASSSERQYNATEAKLYEMHYKLKLNLTENSSY